MYKTGAQSYEFDGTLNTAVPNPGNASTSLSCYYAMLMLSTGEVLVTNQSTDVKMYTPVGAPASAWKPKVTGAPSTVQACGKNYSLSGTLFNGLTRCSAYGDDAQNATKYSLVRVTNLATGLKVYCRTHDHSTMGAATGTRSIHTQFDIPFLIDSGASSREVVTNGIESGKVSLTVIRFNLRGAFPFSVALGSAGNTVTLNGSGFTAGSVINLDGEAQPTTFVAEH